VFFGGGQKVAKKLQMEQEEMLFTKLEKQDDGALVCNDRERWHMRYDPADVKLKRKQVLLGSNLSGIDLIHRLNVEIKDYL
jgi:hypothetical protein